VSLRNKGASLINPEDASNEARMINLEQAPFKVKEV
jgi:hypothetical protein